MTEANPILRVGMWPNGAAYLNGRYVPIEEAAVPITDWGFTRSDATYDVVHVWNGAYFRLHDHLERFTQSMAALRLSPAVGIEEIKQILTECVRRSGLRNAYVSMTCTRGRAAPGQPLHPAYAENRFFAFVLPFVWVMPEDMQARGAHLIVADTPRIPSDCVDPKVKNYHWGDMTRALFEAHDRGAENALLLDRDGNVTEGPGFNVFAVIDDVVVSPDAGALEGITRKSVLELCDELAIQSEIRALPVDELRAADEIFCATTAGGVMPVSRLDERILGNGAPGPISARLRQAYWDKHEAGWHATPIDYGD